MDINVNRRFALSKVLRGSRAVMVVHVKWRDDLRVLGGIVLVFGLVGLRGDVRGSEGSFIIGKERGLPFQS